MTVQGFRARYLCSGSGPPLLVLASPFALARPYMRAMRSLCRSFTVICVELPGSGGSARLAHPWSTERYAEWVVELIRRLPLAAPIVVGHGASAQVAVELSRLAPDEIGGVVRADAAGAARAFGVRELPAFVWNLLRHRTTFADHVKNAWALRVRTSLGLTSAASLVPTLGTGRLSNDGKAMRRFMAAMRRGAQGTRARASSARHALAH